MIQVLKGDLLESDVDVIVHQVNGLGIMGGGIAKAIREKYPKTYIEYKKFCSGKSPETLLGCCYITKEEGVCIANVFGQSIINRPINTINNEYIALEKGLTKVKNYCKQNNLSVGIPYKINCVLGGGDWVITSNIIDRVFADYSVTLYKLE